MRARVPSTQVLLLVVVILLLVFVFAFPVTPQHSVARGSATSAAPAAERPAPQPLHVFDARR